jgi:uncharacterized protein YbjQ (UPF0145 family)
MPDGKGPPAIGSSWDGTGLPPAAEARMERFARSGLRTSLLPVAGAAGVESVGLTPVGEVMGCMVQQIGWQGYGGCGYYGFGGYGSRTVTSGQGQGFAGYRPYVDALYRGYRTALQRMCTEAARMGADGVVGVRLRTEHMGNSSREFVALGTGVRARIGGHLDKPFTTELPGQDVAKLLGAGWVPATIGIGISVAIRHDDTATRIQSSWGSGNNEVDGYTELVTHVRSEARRHFQRAVADAGADGAIVSRMTLNVWSIEPSDGHRDHVAESEVFGTTIARFHRGQSAPTSTLTYLPLRSKTESR